MRKIFLLCFVIFTVSRVAAQEPSWELIGGKISTPWAADVNPERPLPEYPRPQMMRDAWLNLNGLWDYAIRPKETPENAEYDGKILVPFAVESALSGVGKTVGKENLLVYRRSVTLPALFKNKKVLLQFGAVESCNT